jgi:hypothetical protein
VQGAGRRTHPVETFPTGRSGGRSDLDAQKAESRAKSRRARMDTDFAAVLSRMISTSYIAPAATTTAAHLRDAGGRQALPRRKPVRHDYADVWRAHRLAPRTEDQGRSDIPLSRQCSTCIMQEGFTGQPFIFNGYERLAVHRSERQPICPGKTPARPDQVAARATAPDHRHQPLDGGLTAEPGGGHPQNFITHRRNRTGALRVDDATFTSASYANGASALCSRRTLRSGTTGH